MMFIADRMEYDPMEEHDVAMNEVSRQAIYAGLAKCYQLPEPELKTVLESLAMEMEILGSRAAPHTTAMHECFKALNELNQLKVDFAMLFVGPYALLAPPYGSIYLESNRRIMGESTLDVVQYYKNAGLELIPTHRDAPDHIATELEFMSFLVGEEIEALANGNDIRFLELLEIQKTFLTSHLNLWVEGFAQAVTSGAQTEFYLQLAEATKILIAEEANHLLNLQ